MEKAMTDSQITRQSIVSLREVNAETVRQICKLDVSEAQTHFVASNAFSIAQAYFEPKAWFRAIYADETPVGFAMLFKDPEEGDYFLWRFMIDARYQKMGFGKRAMELLMKQVRAWPKAKDMGLSCVPGEEGPELFYAKLGFARTGKVYGDEVEMRREV
jgi:diamine N-acetyltransferase